MWPLFWPGVTFVAVTVSALFFRAALVRALRQWLGPTNALRLLLTAVRFPSMLWCVVVGLFVAIQTVELLPTRMAVQLNLVLEALTLLWTPAKEATVPNLVTEEQLPKVNSPSS